MYIGYFEGFGFNEQFAPVRTWKELLLHPGHADPSSSEKQCYKSGYDELAAHGPVHNSPKALIVQSRIDRGMATCDQFDIGKQLHAQIRGESEGDDPAWLWGSRYISHQANGEPAMVLGVVMQDGWNGLDLGKALDAEEAKIAKALVDMA